MIIVGTAGHIDHGKSSIVRRLTGTDPDRLPEEKARGMTIDLGFAFLTISDKIDLGFVDVPGHERFVKTMIAGVDGIDMVMLVVAADDGWMQQTEEHLQIIRLLGIGRGIVALSKVDLVTDEDRELRMLEIREHLGSTLLESAEIIPISSTTGHGFDHLLRSLSQLASTVTRESVIGYARLAADRVFTQTGIGGVATGTLRDGSLNLNDTVSVWPSLAVGKIKTLQSRGAEVTTALPGFRTALSLSGEARESLVRGSVITTRPMMERMRELPVLVISSEILATSPVPIEERRRLMLLSGTSESTGEARLLFDGKLTPGGNGILFIEPSEPLFALVGDPVILRLESPMVTIGGGRVLARLTKLPQRRQREDYQYFQLYAESSLTNAILLSIRQLILVDKRSALIFSRWPDFAISVEIDRLIASGVLTQYGDAVFEKTVLDTYLQSIESEVRIILENEPHRDGCELNQLKSLAELRESSVTLLLGYGVETGRLRRHGQRLALPAAIEELKGVVKQTYERLLEELTEAGFQPLSLTELGGRGKIAQQVVKISLDRRRSVKIGSQFLIAQGHWSKIVAFLKQHFDSNTQLAIVDLKEKFGITRKFAVPILEETDRLGLTLRQGDVRLTGESLRETTAL